MLQTHIGWLINSIQNFPESKNIKICVLDAGMTTDQVKNHLKKVDVPQNFPIH